MRRSLSRLLLFVIFFVITISVQAQGSGPGPCPNPPCGPPNPVGLPVDGGLIFLLATGIAYAVKKLKK